LSSARIVCLVHSAILRGALLERSAPFRSLVARALVCRRSQSLPCLK